MEKGAFLRKELKEQLNIDEKILHEWERLKLIKPDGFTKDKTPYYFENIVEKVEPIKGLLELGYRLEDIPKIIRKIGLPKKDKLKSTSSRVNEFLTVGALAERVRVSPRAIKHWEEKGIIEPDMRSEGGFRLYSEVYVYLCELIKDLQRFGYSLVEIKKISDLFRDYLSIKGNLKTYNKEENTQKLNEMLKNIKVLVEKIRLLKEGIDRWEGLIKDKKKQIINLRSRNQRRPDLKEKKKR
jgi:DNA-binding transcriptional MerR regulator